MSATVESDKISSYFGGCPIIHVPGRIFPVDVLYLEDAIERTGWSISDDSPYAKRREFHSTAGKGKTLTYLSPGHDKFYQRKSHTDWEEPTVIDEDEDTTLVEGESNVNIPITLGKRYSPQTERTVDLLNERAIPYDLIVRLLEHLFFDDQSLLSFSSAILIFMPGLAEIRRMSDLLSDHPSFGQETLFRVCLLHSTLSSDNQNTVFDVPPAGMRKIVVGVCLEHCCVDGINRLSLSQRQTLQRQASQFLMSLALLTLENSERSSMCALCCIVAGLTVVQVRRKASIEPLSGNIRCQK